MHIDCTDLMVFIGCIIIDPLCDITAGCIKRNFIFSVGYLAASALLIHGTENVKELAYAFFFGITRKGVHFCESDPHKTGCGRKISRQSERTHPAAVSL